MATVAIVIAKSMSSGTNIEQREKYWRQEITANLKPGATKSELEEFASKRGQAIHCYSDGKRRDVCGFDDNQSMGGSRNLALRLAVSFVMKGDVVMGHEFGTAFAEKQS